MDCLTYSWEMGIKRGTGCCTGIISRSNVKQGYGYTHRENISNIEMHVEYLLILLGLIAGCHAEAQYGFGYPVGAYNNHQSSFRAGLPVASLEQPSEQRMFFTTLTVTLATTTSTSITTISTTCTTSTAALKSCSPSKGRRRRAHLDVGALLYNEAEVKEEIDSNIFLIPDKK